MSWCSFALTLLVVMSISREAEAREQAKRFIPTMERNARASVPEPPASPYHRPEHPLAADLQSMALSARIMLDTPSVAPPPIGEVDPRDVNVVDRSVIGNRSTRANTWSDHTRNTNLVFPHVANAIELLLDGDGDRFARDATLLWETMAVTSMITNTVKHAVRRPRPYVYDRRIDYEAREDNNATLSFFSGHTSSSFSMATAYSYLYTKNHPDSPFVVPLWLGTHTIAASTAVLRGLAGKHFWTDVVAGAAAGSAVGLAVPMLHDARQNSDFLADLRIMPLFFQGGFGSGVSGVW